MSNVNKPTFFMMTLLITSGKESTINYHICSLVIILGQGMIFII